MPSVVVDQNTSCNLTIFLLVESFDNFLDLSLTPYSLCIPHINNLSDCNILIINCSTILPFLIFLLPLLIVFLYIWIPASTNLNSVPDNSVQSRAHCQLTSPDVLSATGASMHEKKALVNALVAESMTTGGQGGADQKLETDGTDEFLSAGVEHGPGDVSFEIWIRRRVLLIFELVYRFAPKLNFNLPSLSS